ncbi:hypothetical protein WN55_08291 [Dufourea novaeangliae]|uniref:Uncharacterized protein n=1 Tax=Dufourea novaeangliae TaxID=178035 RepID=A0A154P8R2_DUFNO|nr:hypothetical protein WN55_08291 [Dufourea novaeangliae]
MLMDETDESTRRRYRGREQCLIILQTEIISSRLLERDTVCIYICDGVRRDGMGQKGSGVW